MSFQSKRLARKWSIWCLSATVCFPLFGIDHSLRIDQMHHTAWTDENSGIDQIKQVVQTLDGFLWLKTATNRLLRFDGVRFEPIEIAMAGVLPGGEHRWDDIFSIYAAPGGGLWIGHSAPRVDLFKDGRVQSFTTQDGLPNGPINKMVQGRDGVLWMATTQGLARLEGSRCIMIGLDWGYSGGKPVALLAAKDGTLWVRSHDGRLFYLKQGAKVFAVNKSGSDDANYDGTLAQAPDGTIWQSSSVGLRRVLQGKQDIPSSSASLPLIRVGITEILFDRNGALWFVTADGLRVIPHPELLTPSSGGSNVRHSTSPSESPNDGASTDQFTAKQGLSSNLVWSLLEDREGNIWVGTAAGLDRFRNNMFLKAPLPPIRQEQFALAPGDLGTVWAANWNSPLFNIGGRVLTSYRSKQEGISALHRDPMGNIWIGADGKSLWRWSAGKLVNAGWPPGLDPDYVRAMETDRTGALWVSLGTQGVFRLANGLWSKQNERLQISDSAPVLAIAKDDDGRLWFDTGTLTVLDGGNLKKFDGKNGIVRGYATAIETRGPRTWLGGVFGLALFIDGHFQVVVGTGDETFRGTTGIVELPNGDLWINTISGVVHVGAAEVQKAVRESTYRVQFERFDALEGLEGSANYWIPVPTAILGLDGKLWFSTNKGVFSVDPKRIAQERNLIPPPLYIDSITSAGKRFANLQEIQLPAHTQSIQIDYTALSLSIPERVKFRYLLDGVDRDWQDVGTRRQAFYSNLSPGTYRFRVIACNNDGVWNQSGAVMRFVIVAAWYQTVWFRCLSVIVVLGLLWSLYSLRLARVTAQINSRLNERIRERERIARDLHDTLLQGFQGLMLHFQAVLKQIPKDHQAHAAMENALDRADSVLLEGRDRVRDLRFESDSNSDLADVLQLFAHDLSQDRATEFRISTVGNPRILRPIIHDEALNIAREALTNAFKHSNASSIEVEITYAPGRFQIRIRDDGEGIAPAIVENGRPGHWGLLGMRERASQAGGRLNIWSSQGAGVEIDLNIPGKVAYPPSKIGLRDVEEVR